MATRCGSRGGRLHDVADNTASYRLAARSILLSRSLVLQHKGVENEEERRWILKRNERVASLCAAQNRALHGIYDGCGTCLEDGNKGLQEAKLNILLLHELTTERLHADNKHGAAERIQLRTEKW